MSQPSGLMFHHFHDGAAHPPVQGSLSADELRRIIDRHADRVLNAKDFLALHEQGLLADDALCLTFDDGVRSQYDVARPVLDEYRLTAFFFVPTAPLIGIASRLEIYRYLRTVISPSVEAFYAAWWSLAAPPHAPEGYLAAHGYLSPQDRDFRHWRDEIVTPKGYEAVMDELLAARGWPPPRFADYQALWMTARQVQGLHNAGHIVGAHSHSHPTRLGALTGEAQEIEYQTSHYILTQLLGVPPTAMSHPNNEHTEAGLGLLAALGYTLGFRATSVRWAERTSWGTRLTVPRIDSAMLR